MTFADLLDQIEPDFGRINFRERLMLLLRKKAQIY